MPLCQIRGGNRFERRSERRRGKANLCRHASGPVDGGRQFIRTQLAACHVRHHLMLSGHPCAVGEGDDAASTRRKWPYRKERRRLCGRGDACLYDRHLFAATSCPASRLKAGRSYKGSYEAGCNSAGAISGPGSESRPTLPIFIHNVINGGICQLKILLLFYF